MKIEEVIKQLESILDHTRSMAASPDADDIWRKDIDALKFALTALRSMLEAGEPLTVERLREMDGKPVWIEDVNRWGFVSIPEAGQFKNTPFVLFRKEDVQFEWQIEDSELTVYSYPPAHIDRSKWEACDHCKKACWNCNHNLFAVKEMTKCDDCVNQSKWEFLAYQNYCPKCGRPLTEEAWVELERRVMR